MAHLTVLYDACVLYPAPLRDLLVSLATTGIFRARWSDQIHEEWITSLLRNREDLTREDLERTRQLMDRAVLDCLVVGFEELIPSLKLPDKNDRHVLAAAIRGQANTIITTNLKDFPHAALKNYGIVAQHPDDFIASLLELHPKLVCSVIKRILGRLKCPPVTIDGLLITYDNLGLVQTSDVLRKLTGHI